MEIGLMIEGQEGVSWEQWTEIARACENGDLHALFRSDHYLSFDDPLRRGALDAWATLAGLAAVTRRIRLGTLVSPVTFRHPSVLARSVITVDHVSGGRVELGIGAGWFEREHRAFGFPFPTDADRIAILAEQIEIVHRLWDPDEAEVSFSGQHYRLEAGPALPASIQVPHPPLILGGGAGPRAAALAARWADEYNVTGLAPDEVKEARNRLSAACEAIGRDPGSLRLSLMTGVVVGEDAAEVRARASALMEREGETGDPDRFLERWGPGHVAGTVEQALETLETYAAAGVGRVMLQHLVHDDLETIDLIGREIVQEAGRFP